MKRLKVNAPTRLSAEAAVRNELLKRHVAFDLVEAIAAKDTVADPEAAIVVTVPAGPRDTWNVYVTLTEGGAT